MQRIFEGNNKMIKWQFDECARAIGSCSAFCR
jgi:hypothetical protein